MAYDAFLRTDVGDDREIESVFLISMLKMEVRHQCEFLRHGYSNLTGRLSQIEFWFSVQGILNAAANISKLCWDFSRTPVAVEEREVLRKALRVDDESPFRLRGVRNGFEHIDREIVSAVRASAPGDSFSFRSLPNKLFDGLESINFGEVRTGETTVRFFDEKVDLKELNEEAGRLLDLLAPVRPTQM